MWLTVQRPGCVHHVPHFQEVLDVLQVRALLLDSLSLGFSSASWRVGAEEEQQGDAHHTKDGINLRVQGTERGVTPRIS